MTISNEYENDYYETSEMDIIHFNEEHEGTSNNLIDSKSQYGSEKSLKKKTPLEDWIEEKQLRDQLHNKVDF